MKSVFLVRGLLILLVGFCGADPGWCGADSYREPWRPQFHFTPATNWMNDPNGMVWYDGEYHPFSQFNPLGHRLHLQVNQGEMHRADVWAWTLTSA